MLKGILDFFKNLFSGLFGGKKQPTPPPPPREDTNPPVVEDPDDKNEDRPWVPDDLVIPEVDLETPGTDTPDPDPEIVDSEEDSRAAQDGSDVPPDATEVVIINEMDPVIITEEDPVTIEEPEIPDLPGTGVVDPPEDEEPTENAEPHTQRYLWCLDNGHGSKTAGKRSPKLEDGRQLLEYRFNRDIVRRIEILLKRIGVAYFIVVPEVDTDNFLEGRVKRANQKSSSLPKLFVSVHANAAPAPFGKWSNPSISGIETWFYHNSRRGKKMAAVFQKHLVEKTGFKNRHIKSRPGNQFFVLRKTGMTAVLTENGFYNNKAECLRLLSDEVRDQIAQAHVDAIMEVEVWGV